MDNTEINLNYEKTAVRVSMVSIIGNAALTVFKLFAGIFAGSGAMISDAIHSASDVFSSIIVIIGVKISSKEADRDHPYGHERFESIAAVILAVVLAVTGILLGEAAIEKIFHFDPEAASVPGVLALIAAAVSIASKEGMYWYTRAYAKKLDSGALMADAWHHRSDALSSLGALIGIGGARLGLPILEPIASLLICVLILKAAVDIFRDSIDKVVDHSCPKELEDEMVSCACEQEKVLGVDLIQTRVFGNRIYVDIEIRADKNLTLAEGHEAAQRVHDAIEKRFQRVKHIMVHVNPAEPSDP